MMSETKLKDHQVAANEIVTKAYTDGFAAGFEAAKAQLLAHLGATPGKRRGRPPKKK